MDLKIALVHDQLQEFGGAERVLISLHKLFPEAPVYTAFINRDSAKKHIQDLDKWDIRESWAAKIPSFGRLYSPLRFLAPRIWESFDFTGYDVVISSSGWYMCKGITTQKPTVHISYMHHPPRYLYGYETAVEWQKYGLVKVYAHIVNHYLRQWDYTSSQRPDHFIANSEETKRRIKKFYHRDSSVIYPPVNIPLPNVISNEVRNLSRMRVSSNKLRDSSLIAQNDKGYYITLSRLARAKHIDILIQAANKHKFQLKIIGSGRDEEYLKSIAGDTVEFLGRIEDDEFPTILGNAKGFLFASVDEEFGIAPIEAMGYGVPVIAYKSGGLVETVKDGVNGYLFDELTEESLSEKIKKLESLSKQKYMEMRKSARKESEKYSEGRFHKEIMESVKKVT